MKKIMQIQGYEQQEGCYIQKGDRMTNFILDVKKIIFEKEGVIKYKFTIETTSGEMYIKFVSVPQVKKQHFLQELPLFIKEEQQFYKQLCLTLSEKEFADEAIEYQTGRNGLQKIKEQNMYVFTNGSISVEGFHPEIYSGVGKLYIPEAAVLKDSAEIIMKLFREYDRNPDIFYILFLFNVMAISNGFFRKIGEPEFMKLTLWLDGSSGSGKTELAKAVGAYTFGDLEMNKELIAATGKRRDALRHLAQSSGSVCILDDVKAERVRERKNSMRNIIDDLIRSTFRGRLTDTVGMDSEPEWIDSCVLITGEYLDTCESLNARMMYMKVDGFVDQDKNSQALRVLSKNPMWLTSVCIGYIGWFLGMMSETSFPELLQQKLSELRNSEKMYGEINNSARLNENQYMLKMAAELSKMFFQKIGMSQEFVEHFSCNSKRSIKAITESTFCLLGGEKMLIMKALEKIFMECNIRKAKYQREFWRYNEWKYQQEYFWIRKDEDFVWIDDYKQSILKECQNENDQYADKPCLIICATRFDELFRRTVEKILGEFQISSKVLDKLLANPLKMLREMQIIYKQYRADSKWGRPAVNYPVYELSTVSSFQYPDDVYYGLGYDNTPCEAVICNVDCEPVIQINTEHPCINVLKRRMDNIDPEDAYGGVRGWQIRGITKEEAYHIRKTFTNSKSLYRE
ncbi:MAG: hypothetical protein HDR09_07405 [Lachnospiraceae bacterium]|nr:hypothetical protein [Lachnospiraceae bacterium]